MDLENKFNIDGAESGRFSSSDQPKSNVDFDLGEVLRGLELEVRRQLELWGTEFDDKNTANDWVAYICNYITRGAYAGRKEQYTPQRFTEHLLKAAAVCISAILAIKRNGDCAPRHYEHLLRAGAKPLNNLA